MSTSSNLSQSVYSSSEPETPQTSSIGIVLDFSESYIEKSMKSAQKELHQKRIETLRRELDYLKSTEWEFEVNKGIQQ